MPRQLGPKGRSDLRTTLPHRRHAARVALPVIASGHSDGQVSSRTGLSAAYSGLRRSAFGETSVLPQRLEPLLHLMFVGGRVFCNSAQEVSEA